MKKLLIVHNKYQNIGGEDIAVVEEEKILSQHFEVEAIYFENEIKNIFQLILSFLFSTNLKSNMILKNKITEFNPDIIYVHNSWFTLSLGIFKIAKKMNIKLILKIHNFRYHCTKSHLAENHLNFEDFCQGCGFSNDKKRFYNKYFDKSFIKSFFVNLYGKRYIKVIEDESIPLILLTEFHKKFMVEHKYRNNNIYVIPNYISPNENKTYSKSKYIVYAGRISKEKGVEELLKSFLSSNLNDFKLKIIGDGPLLNTLTKNYQQENIEFLGKQNNSTVLDIISKSVAVISCTKLYEGQPTLLCEASAIGVPSIFPNTGGVLEFFYPNYELCFNQFDYQDLVNKLNKLNEQELLNKIGNNSKEFYGKEFSKKEYIQKMIKLTNEI